MAVFQAAVDILAYAQTEIAIFIVAIFVHTFVFRGYRLGGKKPRGGKGCKRSPGGKDAIIKARPATSGEVIELAKHVKPVLHKEGCQEAILSVLGEQLKSKSSEDTVAALSGLLEHLGKAAGPAIFMAARALLRERGLSMDSRLGETLLRGFLFARQQEQFDEVLAEMEGTAAENGASLSEGIAFLALRAAVSLNNFEGALSRLPACSAAWQAPNASGGSPSAASQQLLQQLVQLAVRKGEAARLLQEIDVPKMLSDKPSLDMASAVLQLLAEGTKGDAHVAVLRLYEEHLCGVVDVLADNTAGRLVAEAALQLGKDDALQRLLAASTDGPRQVALLKSFGERTRNQDKNLEDAFAVFKACPVKTACLYNTLVDVCIKCGDVRAAVLIMKEATRAGLADVITYNTIIKAHLQSGNVQGARAALDAMRTAGLSPNTVTYNELLDEMLKRSREGVWDLIDEMNASGVKPTAVTCSILLKNIQRNSLPSDVERTLKILDSLESDIDEVLLSSVCEACIRAGRSQLLAERLQRHRAENGVHVQGAHTFGSIIRGYGFIKDLRGVWKTWQDMRSRNILPTSITLGCMVEALVNNDSPDAGHDLVREVMSDEQMRPLMNAVIYCSVLKGYSHQRRFDCMWKVREEMRREKLQLSITTYNTLIDACARSSDMARVPKLLEEMATLNIEANVVTYSTILKGYCQENKLDRAFELLRDMQKTKQFTPDEIAYNTLLDGCARHGLYERGMSLIRDMEASGVRPSNFTLSVLVKLCNRANRPDTAFEHCRELCQKYKLTLNIHVYNNLMHSCCMHRNLPRALDVFEQLLKERVRPDVRSYSILLRGCVAAGEAQDAAGLLRAAFGLEPAHKRLAGLQRSALRPAEALPGDLVTEALTDIAGKCGSESLAMEVLSELRRVPGLKMDTKLSVGLTSKALRAPSWR
jgi:pentatricopeptide repeat protein